MLRKPQKPVHTELIDAWDEMLENGKAVANADGVLKQELFCNLMRRTWQVFRDEIDFDMPDDTYALNTELLKLLMKVASYSKLTQISTDGKADIGLSAFLAALMKNTILYRELFQRDKPILNGIFDDHDELYSLSFDMDTGVLTISDSRNVPPPERLCTETLEFLPVPQPIFEPFEVRDLAKPRFYLCE